MTSGLHSDVYFQKARILEQPALTARVGGEIASWYERPSVVVVPAVGAIPLGFAVALAVGARSIFAERDRGRMQLRRGFGIEPGERVLVVEDVVTTGGSAREVYEMAGKLGGELLGVAALIDRSPGELGFPMKALIRLDAASWEPADCPLCERGLAIDSPGSRRLAPTD